MMRARDPDLIRAAMEARGRLTHRELAKLTDIAYGTVGHILDGRSTSRDTAKRIARVLRRRVDELFAAAESSDTLSNVQREAADVRALAG